MLNFLNEAVEEWFKTKKKQEYINGYNYAAGALLRNEETPASLENKLSYILEDFDRGILDCIDKLTENNFIHDNRT